MVFKHTKETMPLNLRMKTNIIYFYSQLSKLDDQVFRVAFECVKTFLVRHLLETTVARIVKLKSQTISWNNTFSKDKSYMKLTRFKKVFLMNGGNVLYGANAFFPNSRLQLLLRYNVWQIFPPTHKLSWWCYPYTALVWTLLQSMSKSIYEYRLSSFIK